MYTKMKKLISLIAAAAFISGGVSVRAAETWRDAFVTRIMKAMSTDLSYTDIVMTDIDQNGIPEAFLIKPGALGDISAGITMSNNSIVSIDVPGNITGECLKDITIYDNGGTHIYVGKEIGRYTNTINYYELTFDGNKLTAYRAEKSYYSPYPAIAYKDYTSSDFFVGGYPSRTKIYDFISGYSSPTPMSVTPSVAKISVDGNLVDVSGYNVNDSNYYKIRDLAMILRSTSKRFNVVWDDSLGTINIVSGVKYTIVGGELSDITGMAIPDVELNQSAIYVNGNPVTLTAYNIAGNNYFKIRDIADLIGFEIGWDNGSQTITIATQ